MLRRLRNLHYRALLCSFFKRKPQIGQQTKPTKEECKFEKIKIQHTNSADSAHKNHSDNSTNSQVIFLNPNMSFKATVPKAGRAFPSPAVVGPSQPQSWDAQGCKAEPGTQMSQTTSPGAAGYRNPARPSPNFLVDVVNKELDQAVGRSSCVPTRAWGCPSLPKAGFSPIPRSGIPVGIPRKERIHSQDVL